MKGGFLKIAITSPEAFPHEASRIASILENKEADLVHIRKPSWNLQQMEGLVREIPSFLHPKLKIHSNFILTERYDLCGVHLNHRNPVAPGNAKSVSISFHSIEQLASAGHYDYVTLSPIFNSISKLHYNSAFSLDELKPHLQGRKVVALGGVTPDKIPLLKEYGFYGCAMLGYFWDKNIYLKS